MRELINSDQSINGVRMDKMKKKLPEKYNCPTKDVDPENFLDNENILDLLEKPSSLKLNQAFDLKLLNCVHCNECETSEERAQLNHRFLEDGNQIEGLEEMRESIREFGTPYGTDQMRIKKPLGIPKKSKTLYYMGCLSTIRVPSFTEDSLQYLLSQNVDFTILDKEMCCGYPLYVSGAFEDFETSRATNIEVFENYEKIICCCPACFHVFKTYYPAEMMDKFVFIADYLKPTKIEKTGKVGIQHLCQLMYRGFPGTSEFVNNILTESGYEVAAIDHWCCGGGIGYMHRLDIIDAIATKRIKDFVESDSDYYTTYCVSCWWILYRFSKKSKVKHKLKSLFRLLSP